MMKVISVFSLVILLILGNSALYSQSSQVKNAFDSKDYASVIDHLKNKTKIKNDAELLMLRGMAYTELGMASFALSDLARAKTLGTEDPNLPLYLGKTYFLQGRYSDALKWLSRYLGTDSKNGLEENDPVYRMIRQANAASRIPSNDQIIVEYPEGAINTIDDNVRPVFSRTANNKFYYTNITPDSKKIVGMEFSEGKWSTPANLPKAINVIGDNTLEDISGDGQVLFFMNTQGKKQFSLYNKRESIDKNIFFQAPYFPHLGDKDLQIVDDKTIVFASRRPDSYGGYDIYVSQYKNDRWSDPINAGQNINSKFNEVSPFLTSDGSALYFSSDRIESLGGYDIFLSNRSSVKSKGYKLAKNLGSPINSPGDDLHFRVDGNGIRSTFCSDRSGGKGGLDIYMTYLNVPVAKAIVDAGHLAFIKYDIESDTPDNEIQEVASVEQDRKPIATTPPPTKQEPVVDTPKKVKEEKPSRSDIANQKKREKEEAKARKEQEEIAKKELEAKEKEAREQKKREEIAAKEKQAREKKKKEEEAKVAYVDPVKKDTPSTATTTEPSKTITTQKTTPTAKTKKEIRKEAKNPVAKITNVSIPTIYYTSEDDFLNIENRNKLDTIAKYIRLIDNSMVELTNFSAVNPRKEYELFFSVNDLDRMVEYLIDKGVGKDRMIINSVGSEYPYIEKHTGSQTSDDLLKLNQRVEIELYNLGSGISVNREIVAVPPSKKARKYQIFKTVKDDVHYRLLFEETSRIFKNRVLTYYDDIIITKQLDDENYLYALGFYQTYDSAIRVQNDMISKNLPNTEIVPFYGSKRLTDREVLKLVPSHSNLRPYMDKMQ
jgi:outer membrane protein OmpA-like peptidoglycan-associated protein